MPLNAAQTDRAAGVLLGLACGDALGAGYEFGPPLASDVDISMRGGGSFGWAPGEWTDDTSMAIAIAELTSEGADLRVESTQDALVSRWVQWAGQAKDVGIQTSSILRSVAHSPTAADARKASQQHHDRSGRSGGNGSLMRTAPVALAMLGEPAEEIAATARAISALTHFDPEAGDACALLCVAIDHAVRTGELDLRIGIDQIPLGRQDTWLLRLDDAELKDPSAFTRNGWVVEALQGAWSAITRTPVPMHIPGAATFDCQHLQHALEAAVRGGNDTDTVAAIAGSLLGAKWGRSAIPSAWWRKLHGWPGLRARDLLALGLRSATGDCDPSGWPMAPHFDYSAYGDVSIVASVAHEPRLVVSGVDAARDLPDGVDAVVSLCRLGSAEVPANGVAPENHVEVWLIDKSDPIYNPHLGFVLHDAQQAMAALLAEGRTLLLHCVQAQSRTPSVLALHIARTSNGSASEAFEVARRALPSAHPNHAFVHAVESLTRDTEVLA